MQTVTHIWQDPDRKPVPVVDLPERRRFYYSKAMFGLNIGMVVLYALVAVFLFARYWRASYWPYAVIFALMFVPVFKNLHEIYRGPHTWTIDPVDDLVRVDRFDGSSQTWRLSSLRRLPRRNIGAPYRVVDQNGDLAFDIWIYVSRQDELAKCFQESSG